MRIISGKYKGTNIPSPKEEVVKPTLDRIKENIELELELQSSTENEDEESTYDEDEYLEESEENT